MKRSSLKYILLSMVAAPLFGSCLTVDTITVMPLPKCASGTCSFDGAVSGADLRGALIPRFQMTAHNSCKTKQPAAANIGFAVDVSFYDKDGFRTGVGSFLVASLEPGEKVKHAYDIPDDARVLGAITEVRVKTITETFVGAGGK